ncbi:MAG: hypothetical protein ACD_39C00750G0002 [uncultured bacterium]|nr:MAG: hypothetical protein ACD_39C00750G0002 [uncultured bacterium]
MLSIAVLASFIVVVQQHAANFYEENLLLIALDVFSIMLAMAVGLYFMRAESGGKAGLFELAANFAQASSEEQNEFVQKYRAARESLFSAGMFFCLLLILKISLNEHMAGLRLVHYQLLFLITIPVIATLLLETILKLFLRLKAGIRNSLPVESDLWLNWLGYVVLACLAVIWLFPYDEPDACAWIFLALPAAGVVSGINWFVRRNRKAAEKGGGL